jgi:hypothetical protein
MSEPIFMKPGMHIMAPKLTSTAYFINPSHRSVRLYVHPRVSLLGSGLVDTFLWQRIHATIEELLTAPLLCYQCLIKGEPVDLSVYPPIVARQWHSKDVSAATKNCWRCHFLCGLCDVKGN